MSKFDIIKPNSYGRKKVIRYKQYEYGNQIDFFMIRDNSKKLEKNKALY